MRLEVNPIENTDLVCGKDGECFYYKVHKNLGGLLITHAVACEIWVYHENV